MEPDARAPRPTQRMIVKYVSYVFWEFDKQKDQKIKRSKHQKLKRSEFQKFKFRNSVIQKFKTSTFENGKRYKLHILTNSVMPHSKICSTSAYKLSISNLSDLACPMFAKFKHPINSKLHLALRDIPNIERPSLRPTGSCKCRRPCPKHCPGSLTGPAWHGCGVRLQWCENAQNL